jgi:hypothetical protein
MVGGFMKKLPIGIQTFREIIEDDYLYIDKTEYVYNLINKGKCYFLSRPRRFGKSLLLDTIAEAFSGDRELFKGLWIYDSDYNFPKHPVLKFDMSRIANESSEIFEETLASDVSRLAENEELVISGTTPSFMLSMLIEMLYKKHGQRIVVLIDEYDKPILDRINNREVADRSRDVLRGFYGILKTMDA